MAEYVQAAEQSLLEAQQWQIEVAQEQLAAVNAKIQERQCELDDLKRKYQEAKRQNALAKVVHSYTICLAKRVLLA